MSKLNLTEKEMDAIISAEKLREQDKKTTEILDKIETAIAGVAISSTVIPLITTLNLEPINQAISIGATMLILSPINYKLFRKAQAKVIHNMDKDIHHMNQLMLMLLETREKDRQIGELTSNFLPEITALAATNKMSLDLSTKENLNQFLYMINANYYNQITKNLPSLDREQLIENIISITLENLKEKEIPIFTNKDTKNILDKCYYIKPEIKKEIIKEFKASKAKVDGKEIYQIIRKDMDIDQDINIYHTKKEEEIKTNPKRFDIENKDHYTTILEILETQDVYNQYGNIKDVTWDLDFLQSMLVFTATKFRKQLKTAHPDYCNFNLVASFMHNAAIYTLVNNKDQVGKVEMINTFKQWPYLNYQLKTEILDSIFTEFALDFKENPYHKSQKNKQKILKFPIYKK